VALNTPPPRKTKWPSFESPTKDYSEGGRLIFLYLFLFIQNLSATIYDQSTFEFVSHINDDNSAVALVLPALHVLPQKDGTLQLQTFTMDESWNLCSSEPLTKEPPLTTACTGFLIAPDVLVTAGHCMVTRGEVKNDKNAYCDTFVFLFNYAYGSDQKVTPIKAEQLVGCKKIIYASNFSSTDLNTGKTSFGKDIAYVQLDRAMPFKPLKVAEKSVTVDKFTPSTITMLGHPMGMPMVKTWGTALEHNGEYLRAVISSFPANSGSAVKNNENEVIGLLVRGYPDSFVEQFDHKCSIHNRCDANAEKCTVDDPVEKIGEHVQLIDQSEVSLKMFN